MAKLQFAYVLILAGLTAPANGACYIGPILTVIRANGAVQKYCHIQELKLNISEGQYLKSFDTCYEYRCLPSGLNACGFGFRAGIFVIPGCKSINVGCDIGFVQDPKSHIKCPEDPDGEPATKPPTVQLPTIPRPSTRKGWGTPATTSMKSVNWDELCDGTPGARGELRDLICSTGVRHISCAVMCALSILLTTFVCSLIN